MKGILGRKQGMTRLFMEDGVVEAVSVLEAGPCVVAQVKTRQRDGYQAVQIGYEEARKLNEPEAGPRETRRAHAPPARAQDGRIG